MKHKIYLLICIGVLSFTCVHTQTIKLSFTGEYDTLFIPMDSVLIKNLTQGGDTTLFYPDTNLILNTTTGLGENSSALNSFYITQNFPNPFISNTYFNINIPKNDYIRITVYDASGRKLSIFSGNYNKGIHKFSFSTGKSGFNIVNIAYKNQSFSIKMFCMGNSKNDVYEIKYIGSDSKTVIAKKTNSKSNFKFSLGDQLRFIGYCQSDDDTAFSVPIHDTLIIFNFHGLKICPPMFVDIRDGNVYTAVMIGNQCWMSKNLAYLPSVSNPNDGSNYIPILYVYDYSGYVVSQAKATSNYHTYGALYNWPAAMEGYGSSNSVPSMAQGACPNGWHVPSDEEWKILEGTVDNMFGYPDQEWDGSGWRGYSGGGSLKSTDTTYWKFPNIGATDNFGFNALAGGGRGYFGDIYDLFEGTSFWTSTQVGNPNAWRRYLNFDHADIDRMDYSKSNGRSVRCVKDMCFQQPSQAYAGQDTLDVIGDTITLNANTPILGKGEWSIISGAMGIISGKNIPNALLSGFPGITYYLVWTINNYCGYSSDTVIISFVPIHQPCPGIPSITYGGQKYNTIKVGTQCWMKENLNIGTMINSNIDQSNNGTIEKYCYSNNNTNCIMYGGLYQWDEIMQYDTIQGTQGICPTGWHLPSDEEWKILEGAVDSLYGYPDQEWDKTNWRGFNAGLNLKSTNFWYSNGNGTDLHDFTVLAAGYRSNSGTFWDLGEYTSFWSSTENNSTLAWRRSLRYNTLEINRYNTNKMNGYSIRCLKD